MRGSHRTPSNMNDQTNPSLPLCYSLEDNYRGKKSKKKISFYDAVFTLNTVKRLVYDCQIACFYDSLKKSPRSIIPNNWTTFFTTSKKQKLDWYYWTARGTKKSEECWLSNRVRVQKYTVVHCVHLICLVRKSIRLFISMQMQLDSWWGMLSSWLVRLLSITDDQLNVKYCILYP